MPTTEPVTLADVLTVLVSIRDTLAAPPSELIDRETLAAMLMLGVSTLDTQRAAGRIGPQPVRVGGSIRWQRDEVAAWLRTPTASGELHDAKTWPHVWQAMKSRKK